MPKVALQAVNADAIQRATERLRSVRERSYTAETSAALERARRQLEAFAETAAELEATLPTRVGEAVRDGLRAETLPVARQLAEVRGLQSQVLRRLEHLEVDLAAERHARVDDLAVLVDLVASSWRSVNERIGQLEDAIAGRGGEAVVLRLDKRAG
jgi:hypothetical protein